MVHVNASNSVAGAFLALENDAGELGVVAYVS